MGESSFNDPATYRALSEPFADTNAANEAIHRFLRGVSELRKECRVPDVLISLSANVQYGDGKEGEVALSCHFGDSRNAEMLAAFALGQFREERQADINATMKRAGGARRGERGTTLDL